MKLEKTKIYSIIITLIVIGIIFILGPASAISLKISDFTDTFKGNKVSTQLDIEINSNERIELSNISIYLNGIYLCEFNHKTLDSNCQEIEIEKLTTNENYGYGYGYSYGYIYPYGYGYGYNQGYSGTILSYKLTFDTSYLSIGENKIFIQTDIGRIYKSDEKILNIYQSSYKSSSGSSSYKKEVLPNIILQKEEQEEDDKELMEKDDVIKLEPEKKDGFFKRTKDKFVNTIKRIWDWIIFWR